MKNKFLPIIAVCLIVVLIALIVVVQSIPSDHKPDPEVPTQSSAPTIPTTTPTEPSTVPTEPTFGTEATTPTETVPPTEATQPPTEATEPPTQPPTQPGVEYIGSLYTREQLMAMENVRKGYGPGTTSNGVRPSYPISLQKTYEQYGGHFIAPDNNCIYLTFDCGYEYQDIMADILDTLKEKDVKAVFFVTMQFIRENPEYVQRMIDEGHAVGNHTRRHKELPNMTIDAIVADVMEVHQYMLDHFNYKMTLFRPPTGSFSTRSLAVMQSLGYKSVLWSFAYKDWETANQPDPAQALKTITGRHHSGAIYLLHAVSRTNADVLGEAIDFFRAQGYQLELFE